MSTDPLADPLLLGEWFARYRFRLKYGNPNQVEALNKLRAILGLKADNEDVYQKAESFLERLTLSSYSEKVKGFVITRAHVEHLFTVQPGQTKAAISEQDFMANFCTPLFSSEDESKKTPAADSSDEDGPAKKFKIPVCTHTAISSLTSALSHLGNSDESKLAKLLNAPVEQMERTMQFVNSTARSGGWHLTTIKSLEEGASFDPLTACPDGSVLLMYLKQADKTASFIHSVAIANGFIFDTNHAPLPLNPESLTAINYAGIIQASVLTPKAKIAKAMLKRKRSKELDSFPTAEEEASSAASAASDTDADGGPRKRKRKSGGQKRGAKAAKTAEGGYMAHALCQLHLAAL